MVRFASIAFFVVLGGALGSVFGSVFGTQQAFAASSCKVQSPAHRVALVELYTSQGCSSCPPADRWLTTLPQRFASTEAIPLSLHVGYWDYIGWKDPFAKREFNERQRVWATVNHSRSVYTPGVFVQGREVPGWHVAQSMASQVKATNALTSGARIEVGVRSEGQRLNVEVSAMPASTPSDASLHVALVQSGLTTAVKAGENRGERLINDHVVREWSAPLAMGQHKLSYTLPAGASLKDWAIVAFAQRQGNRELLQAVRWTAQDCRS